MGQICCRCKSVLCHLLHLCKDQGGGTLIHRVFIPCKKHLIVQIASTDISVLISHRLCLRDSYATATRESSPSMTFGWALTSRWRTAWVRGTSSRGGQGCWGGSWGWRTFTAGWQRLLLPCLSYQEFLHLLLPLPMKEMRGVGLCASGALGALV